MKKRWKVQGFIRQAWVDQVKYYSSLTDEEFNQKGPAYTPAYFVTKCAAKRQVRALYDSHAPLMIIVEMEKF